MKNEKNKNRYKLMLVCPGIWPGHGRVKDEPGKISIAPLTLPYLAGLKPPKYKVSIVDENLEKIDFEKEVDIVGITVLTIAENCGYQIATKFRERGTTVV